MAKHFDVNTRHKILADDEESIRVSVVSDTGDAEEGYSPVRSVQESSEISADGVVVTPKFAAIAISASGDNAIVAAVPAKKIRVLQLTLVANAAVNAKLRSATTDKTGLYYLAANGGVAEPYTPVGIMETVAGEALNINLSGAVAVGGHLTYIEV